MTNKQIKVYQIHSYKDKSNLYVPHYELSLEILVWLFATGENIDSLCQINTEHMKCKVSTLVFKYVYEKIDTESISGGFWESSAQCIE